MSRHTRARQWALGAVHALAVTFCVACNPSENSVIETPTSVSRPTAPAAPLAARKPHVATHHGITLEDPYYWLRDPGYPDVTDPEVLAYLEAENAYFEARMAPLRPLVETLFEEIKARQQPDESSVPFKEGDYEYQWRFEPGGQYRIWSRWPVGRPAEAKVILDEPALAEGNDFFRVGSFDVSPDGRLLAWSQDTNGSERYLIQVKDLATGEILPDRLEDMASTVVWARDNATLFYLELTANWRPFRVRAHRLETPVAADRTLYEEVDDGFFVAVDDTQSREFIVISTGDHDTTELRVFHADRPEAEPRLIAARRSNHEYALEHHGEFFYILTNDRHKNFRLVRAPVADPGEGSWQEVIAPSDRHYLLGLTCFRDMMVLEERVDGLDQVRVRAYDGQEHRIAFPEPVYTAGLGTNAEYEVTRLRVEYESMVTPDTVFDYDLATRQLIVRKVQQIPSGYDASRYVSERVMARARDGVEVPVSIVHRRDFERGTGAPLYLYGYGAYAVAMPPGFSISRLSLLDRGFAFAIAHVRGGDELGYAWYEAGKLDKRPNTFNDFVDVARALVTRGYTDERRMVISGGSAGGELVAAAINQAPELWGAAVLHVPFVDVLNTMLDASLPLTPLEWPQWGNPLEDPQAFELIRSYSPYDQLKPGDYPPMLVTAGLHDPRVTYWEAAKYVAKLRHVKRNDAPLLFKINLGAGHQGRSGRFEAIREVAEEYAFVLDAMGRADVQRNPNA